MRRRMKELGEIAEKVRGKPIKGFKSKDETFIIEPVFYQEPKQITQQR